MRQTSVTSLFSFLFLSPSFLRFGIFEAASCEIRSARCAPPLKSLRSKRIGRFLSGDFARPEGAPERRIRSFVRIDGSPMPTPDLAVAHVCSPVRVQIVYRADTKPYGTSQEFSANFCLLDSSGSLYDIAISRFRRLMMSNQLLLV